MCGYTLLNSVVQFVGDHPEFTLPFPANSIQTVHSIQKFINQFSIVPVDIFITLSTTTDTNDIICDKSR